MNRPQRIYLDNAATSWPKPEAVYLAVDRYQREIGAAAGRGAYAESLEAARLVADARRRAAALLGASDSSRVIFTSSGTDGLNLALHGVLRPGDHVVTTVLEHNSVLRPLAHLVEERGIEVTQVACGADGQIDPDDIRRALRPSTALVAITHASNVTGVVQPVAMVGHSVREHGALLLVDAAQTLGHFPFTVDELQADLLAAPGHKGLLGPLGVGLLYVRPDVETRLRPTRQGGTGTQSELPRQPETLPDRYEPGNHNLPGLAGLGAALAWLAEQAPSALFEHGQALRTALVGGLVGVPGITLYCSANSSDQGSTPRAVEVLSLSVAGYDPQELAAILESTQGIQARAGLHCAPLAHGALGTLPNGGTLRLSWGPFNTQAQIDLVVEVLRTVATSA
jgi:cysteine desulfurase family protein